MKLWTRLWCLVFLTHGVVQRWCIPLCEECLRRGWVPSVAADSAVCRWSTDHTVTSAQSLPLVARTVSHPAHQAASQMKTQCSATWQESTLLHRYPSQPQSYSLRLRNSHYCQHVKRSLATLFVPLHVAPKLCRSSANVICQVFRGLPLNLFSSFIIHFTATFAVNVPENKLPSTEYKGQTDRVTILANYHNHWFLIQWPINVKSREEKDECSQVYIVVRSKIGWFKI